MSWKTQTVFDRGCSEYFLLIVFFVLRFWVNNQGSRIDLKRRPHRAPWRIWSQQRQRHKQVIPLETPDSDDSIFSFLGRMWLWKLIRLSTRSTTIHWGPQTTSPYSSLPSPLIWTCTPRPAWRTWMLTTLDRTGGFMVDYYGCCNVQDQNLKKFFCQAGDPLPLVLQRVQQSCRRSRWESSIWRKNTNIQDLANTVSYN